MEIKGSENKGGTYILNFAILTAMITNKCNGHVSYGNLHDSKFCARFCTWLVLIFIYCTFDADVLLWTNFTMDLALHRLV